MSKVSQDMDKITEMVKRFSTLRNEHRELEERLHQIKERMLVIENEMSDIRNYLYRDRSKDYILDVSSTVNTMIEEDKTGEYKKSLHELQEVIELWLRDYDHYIRYGVDNLKPPKEPS